MKLHIGRIQKISLISKYPILITVFIFLFVNIGMTEKAPISNNFEYFGDSYFGMYNGSLNDLDHKSYGNSVFKVLNNHRAKPISYWQINEENSFYRSAEEGREGNATTTFFIALIPGFFVHGLGHNYIGDKKTFKILLITEVISLPIIYFSAIGSSSEQFEEGKDIPLADAALIVSISAFMISWIYDFVGAPIKAEYTIIDSTPEQIFANIPYENNAKFGLKLIYSF